MVYAAESKQASLMLSDMVFCVGFPLPDSHLKPVCGEEREAKPRSTPVLAWDTETFTCVHEDTAESYVGLEKTVAFGRVASGGWGRRKKLFIQTICARTSKHFFFF